MLLRCLPFFATLAYAMPRTLPLMPPIRCCRHAFAALMPLRLPLRQLRHAADMLMPGCRDAMLRFSPCAYACRHC